MDKYGARWPNGSTQASHREVRVRAFVRALCGVLGKTLQSYNLPLFANMYKWGPANYKQELTLAAID